MFVVRIDDGDKAGFKGFAALPDAERHFNRASLKALEGIYRTVGLYEVPGADNARAAIQAVRQGSDKIRLLEVAESDDASMQRMARKLAAKR